MTCCIGKTNVKHDGLEPKKKKKKKRKERDDFYGEKRRLIFGPCHDTYVFLYVLLGTTTYLRWHPVHVLEVEFRRNDLMMALNSYIH